MKRTSNSDVIDKAKWTNGMSREELLKYFTENPDRNLNDTDITFSNHSENITVAERNVIPVSEPLSPVIK